MLVLAVDTTSAHGSLALLEGPALRGVMGFRTARPRHAESLLPMVDYLLKQVEGKLDDVDGLAVAVGPGSFTGLRIGIAAVEGLAFTLNRPAVGVSSLEATAFRYRHRQGYIVAMIEAYRGEVYGASYESDGVALSPVSEPTCGPPEDFLESLPRAPDLIAGSGVSRYRAVVDERLPGSVTVAEPSFFIAEEIGRLGAVRLEAGERAPLGGLEPLYVRASEAERNRARAGAKGPR